MASSRLYRASGLLGCATVPTEPRTPANGTATALDLCAGAGGLSLGLRQAGFEVRGVELNPIAVATHRREVGLCDLADVWQYLPGMRYDLVAAGIPCQSHTRAMPRKRGRAGTADERGKLFNPVIRIAREAEAKALLIENVVGIMSSPSESHGTAIQELLNAIKVAGFAFTFLKTLDAVDYGIPQFRRRVFVVVFRDDVQFNWPDPIATAVCVRDALALGDGVFRSGRVQGAHHDIGYRMLDVDRPAFTVLGKFWDLIDGRGFTAHRKPSGKGLDSKDDAIRLTREQVAILQGFPKGFKFDGGVRQGDLQVGNAVPPPLAFAIGQSIRKALGL